MYRYILGVHIYIYIYVNIYKYAGAGRPNLENQTEHQMPDNFERSQSKNLEFGAPTV